MSDGDFAETDVASVLHPMTSAIAHAQNGPDIVMKGEGAYIFDEKGSKAIDAMSGLWALPAGDALGFCPPLFCTKEELDEITDKFKTTSDQSVAHAAQFGG